MLNLRCNDNEETDVRGILREGLDLIIWLRTEVTGSAAVSTVMNLKVL
jgi:hypothetical protein